MKKQQFLLVVLGCLLFIGVGCRQQSGKKRTDPERASVKTTLFDKELPEIKKLVDGKWELVSGQNARELCEFENTFITFDGDKYIWTEDGKDEPGDLNWRKADTKAGYESYLMDVFYETNPAYPLSISGDTLLIQDCSETGYKYTLLRR